MSTVGPIEPVFVYWCSLYVLYDSVTFLQCRKQNPRLPGFAEAIMSTGSNSVEQHAQCKATANLQLQQWFLFSPLMWTYDATSQDLNTPSCIYCPSKKKMCKCVPWLILFLSRLLLWRSLAVCFCELHDLFSYKVHIFQQKTKQTKRSRDLYS